MKVATEPQEQPVPTLSYAGLKSNTLYCTRDGVVCFKPSHVRYESQVGHPLVLLRDGTGAGLVCDGDHTAYGPFTYCTDKVILSND